jgi:catalase (peroxidase I)
MDPPPQLARKRSHRSKDKLVKRSESSNALEEIASSGDLVTLSAAAAAEAAAAEAAVAAAATTAASATSISQPTQDFKDHPTIRTYRNEYSNWRRGAPRGSSGELTNDRLSGLTVRFLIEATRGNHLFVSSKAELS